MCSILEGPKCLEFIKTVNKVTLYDKVLKLSSKLRDTNKLHIRKLHIVFPNTITV